MRELRYGVMGAGRWGTSITKILDDMGRDVSNIPATRRAANETKDAYLDRIMAQIQVVPGQLDALWFAVPPGDQDVLAAAAIQYGAQFVAEKPWQVPVAKSRELAQQASKKGMCQAVHFQFCYLDGLGELGIKMCTGAGPLRFDGCFMIERDNRLGLDPYHNLASHLLAIQHVHFPEAVLGTLKAAYNSPNCRRIDLLRGRQSATIDFTNSQEPLIQKFVIGFEQRCQEGLSNQIDIVAASQISARVSGFLSQGHW